MFVVTFSVRLRLCLRLCLRLYSFAIRLPANVHADFTNSVKKLFGTDETMRFILIDNIGWKMKMRKPNFGWENFFAMPFALVELISKDLFRIGKSIMSFSITG